MDPVTTVCLVCGLPICHQGEHETTEDCCEALVKINAELLEAAVALDAWSRTCPPTDLIARLAPILSQVQAAVAKATGGSNVQV